MPVPLRYNLKSLLYRKTATTLTLLAVALTVGVLIVLLAVARGFRSAVADTGRTDNIICMRTGATSEGESVITRDQLNTLQGLSGIAMGSSGRPLVAGELYAAVSLDREGGGATNVPVRGVSLDSMEIRGTVRLVAGRQFRPGSREVMVGEALVDRIRNCRIGGAIAISKDPWEVVGIISDDGKAFSSEIWGDAELLLQAFDRTAYNACILRVAAGTDPGSAPTYEGPITSRVLVTAGTGLMGRITERMGELKVQTEREYFTAQSGFLGGTLTAVAIFLTVLMSIGALAGCTNTLLAAVAGRTREVGGLLALGYRPLHVFLGFLCESLALCLAGGALGILCTLPLNDLKTGTTNWATFTEQAFRFQIDGPVILTALGLALLVGLIGGVLPAWRAARLRPVDALRRG
jgi:ABC-type lipoprotein release transport system permease subunit